MTSIEKLAKLFNDRNNKYQVNVTTGVVISVIPLKVKWGESIILEGNNLIISNTVKNLINSETLLNNNKVILMPDGDFKNWYLIDKVG